MTNFHPTNEAFFWPIAYAIPGGLFGVSIGWVLSGYLDGGIILGVIFSFATWAILSVFWLVVLLRSYGPAHQADPVQHITDAEVAPEFDPARISIKCYSRGDSTTHYLIDLPTEYANLQRFAEGIERDHKTTAFSEWSGAAAGGFVWNNDQDYKAIIKWLCDYGYGLLDRNNKLVITANGHDLFEDLLNPQFVPPSPINFDNLRNIRQYPDTNN